MKKKNNNKITIKDLIRAGKDVNPDPVLLGFNIKELKDTLDMLKPKKLTLWQKIKRWFQ